VALTGHSLGGNITSALVQNNPGVQGVTFNAGAGLPRWADIKCKLPGRLKPAYCGNLTNYRTRLDPVSLLGRFGGGFGNWKTLPATRGLNTHTIGNFVP
jgi:hypothetical protein